MNVSTGSTIACAMELSELGLLDSDLHFRRADLLVQMVEDIGYRRGLGAELADGSLRLGDRVVIKRRGAQLGQLKPHDLIETGLEKNDSCVTLASTELLAHRTIYMQTPALAICHCHPRTAIASSLINEPFIEYRKMSGAYNKW